MSNLNFNQEYTLQDIVDNLNNENNANLYGDFLDFTRNKFKNGEIKENFFNFEPKRPNDLDKKHISYFVAVIHSLCHEFNINTPKWILNNKFVLEDPYFAMNAKGMLRISLIFESPKEFRMRNMYMTENVIRRV